MSGNKKIAVMWAVPALWGAAYLLMALAPITKEIKVAALNAIYLLPPLLAVIATAAAFTRSKSAERSFWFYLAVAIASLLVGEVIWAYYEVIRHIEPPQPSAADFFYLGAYPFYGLALLAMARCSGRLTVAKARYLLDLLMAMIVSVAVLWVFVLKPLYADHPSVSLAAKAVNSTYPIADLVILFGLLVNMLGLKVGKYRPWEVLIAVGVAAYFTGDVLYNFFSTAGIYDADSFWAKTLDLTWAAGYWLYLMAAVYRLTHADVEQPRAFETGEARPGSKWSEVGIPAVLIFIVPWLIYEAARSRNFYESVTLSSAAVVLPFLLLQRSAAVFYLRQAYMHVLTDVTGGRLVMMTKTEMELCCGAPVSAEIALNSFADLAPARRRMEATIKTSFPGFTRGWDLTVAACEAMSNAIKHAGSGRYQIYQAADRIQVAVHDDGPGIDFTLLPRAVLVSGFSTVDSLGKGFSIMLGLCDRVLLSTEPRRTTVVLEMGYSRPTRPSDTSGGESVRSSPKSAAQAPARSN